MKYTVEYSLQILNFFDIYISIRTTTLKTKQKI